MSSAKASKTTDESFDKALFELLTKGGYERTLREFMRKNPSDQEIRQQLTLGIGHRVDSQHGIIALQIKPKIAVYWNSYGGNGIKPRLEGPPLIAKVRELLSTEPTSGETKQADAKKTSSKVGRGMWDGSEKVPGDPKGRRYSDLTLVELEEGRVRDTSGLGYEERSHIRKLRDEYNRFYEMPPNENGVYTNDKAVERIPYDHKGSGAYIEIRLLDTPAGWISSRAIGIHGSGVGCFGQSGPLTTGTVYESRDAALRACLNKIPDSCKVDSSDGQKVKQAKKLMREWAESELAKLELDLDLVPDDPHHRNWSSLSDVELEQWRKKLFKKASARKPDKNAAAMHLRVMGVIELRECITNLREEVPLSPDGTLRAALETYSNQPVLMEIVQAEIDRRKSLPVQPDLQEPSVVADRAELMPLQPSLFDYGTLDATTASIVQYAASEIKRLYRMTVDCAIEIGGHLLDVKNRLYGRYGEWLKAEFDMSERSARDFEYMAQQFGDVELPDQMPLSVMRILAQPSTPKAAQKEVIERVKEGEKITVEETRQTVTKHTEKTYVQTNILEVPGVVEPKEEPAIIAEAGIAPVVEGYAGKCVLCFCTDDDPCLNSEEERACRWTDKSKTLCSNCETVFENSIAQNPASNEAQKSATSDVLSNPQIQAEAILDRLRIGGLYINGIQDDVWLIEQENGESIHGDEDKGYDSLQDAVDEAIRLQSAIIADEGKPQENRLWLDKVWPKDIIDVHLYFDPCDKSEAGRPVRVLALHGEHSIRRNFRISELEIPGPIVATIKELAAEAHKQKSRAVVTKKTKTGRPTKAKKSRRKVD